MLSAKRFWISICLVMDSLVHGPLALLSAADTASSILIDAFRLSLFSNLLTTDVLMPQSSVRILPSCFDADEHDLPFSSSVVVESIETATGSSAVASPAA